MDPTRWPLAPHPRAQQKSTDRLDDNQDTGGWRPSSGCSLRQHCYSPPAASTDWISRA